VWSIQLLAETNENNCDEKNNDNEKHSNKSKLHNYALYSVADGKIMQHSFQFSSGHSSTNLIANANVKTINFYTTLIENELKNQLLSESNNEKHSGSSLKAKYEYGLTEFAILELNKSELYFMIGKFDGSMELYKKCLNEQNNIQKLCTFFNHQKLVTCIKWRKDKLIASGSNDFNVIIIDFSMLINEELKETSPNQNDRKFFSKFKHKLVGHKERITNLSWSNCEKNNILASCSYDSTVQVNIQFKSND
jgi:WD40 repeat protein